MINRDEATQIVNDFLSNDIKNEQWFQNITPFIKAIILYGSTAKGTNREDSDIDILIILPLEQEEKYTIGEYIYNYKNTEINIVLRSIEKLRTIAQEKKDTFQKEVFRNSEILTDTDGEVTSLLKEIDKI
jgi:predicted nucleotidyltransferase